MDHHGLVVGGIVEGEVDVTGRNNLDGSAGVDVCHLLGIAFVDARLHDEAHGLCFSTSAGTAEVIETLD